MQTGRRSTSDQEVEEFSFFSFEDQYIHENMLFDIPSTLSYDTVYGDNDLNFWLQNASPLSSGVNPVGTVNNHSSIEANIIPNEIPVMEAVQYDLKIYPSSEIREDHVVDDDYNDEEDVKQTPESIKERRKKNDTEKLRRLKFKEKVNVLQELVPNCSKRDIASTLDDAIDHIKALRYQIQQMMSMQPGYPMFHSPMMMMIPQPGHLGMQMPFPPQQTDALRGGTGIGMGMSGMFPLYNFPMSQLGLPYPHLLTSLATSGLPSLGGISASTPGNSLDQLQSAVSSTYMAPFSASSSGFNLR